MIVQLIHHPTNLSGFGLGFCLALACWAEAQRHRGVRDWTAQTGWAHRERRVLQLLLLDFKSQHTELKHARGYMEARNIYWTDLHLYI